MVPRFLSVALLVTSAAGAMLAGCAGPGAGPTAQGSYYAPYDFETNPTCGALGTCQPLNTEPRPLRGSSGW